MRTVHQHTLFLHARLPGVGLGGWVGAAGLGVNHPFQVHQPRTVATIELWDSSYINLVYGLCSILQFLLENK